MFQRAAQLVALLSLIAVAVPALRAEDAPPSAVSPTITAAIPDNAIAAIVINPQGALKASTKLQSLADEFTKNTGIPPTDVEQIIGIVGLPTPEQIGGKERPFEGAVIFRLMAPAKAEELAAKVLAPATPEKMEVAGKPYFVAAKSGQRPAAGRPSCVALIDDRTLLSGNEADVRAMASTEHSRSPLVKALAAADLTADMTAIVVNRDDIRAAAAAMKASGNLPPPLMVFADLPALTDTVTISVKATPSVTLAIALDAKDAASAEKVAALMPVAKRMLAAMAGPLKNMPRERMAADDKAVLDFLLERLDKVVADFAPRQAGQRVTIEISGLGTLDDWAAKLEVPISKARQAAKRMVSLNNLKQFALAILSYEAAFEKFPARAIFSKDGKPLLSWRVAILPYIEQEPLYKQFHLDEPWDSENNKPLIAKMPAIFADPNAGPADAGHTRYQVVTGPGTVFEGDKACRIADITDGTSNTLLVVEVGADKSVIWTKPDDVEFDPKQPLAAFGTLGVEGFKAVFCDGAARIISNAIDTETLNHLIQRADGQPIDTSKF